MTFHLVRRFVSQLLLQDERRPATRSRDIAALARGGAAVPLHDDDEGEGAGDARQAVVVHGKQRELRDVL